MRLAANAALAALLLSMPAVAAPPEGHCEVKVTGGAEFTYQGKGGSTAVSSDHWYTEEELRKAIEASINALTKDPAKRQAQLDKAMKDGGRFVGPLVLNCVSSEGSSAGNLNILPTDKNTRKTVPFKPGTYKLAPRSAKPNELRVMFRAKGVTYSLTGPGELVIQRFDATGIAGTFSFPAKSAPFGNKPGTAAHSITVTGDFDFPCSAPSEMCRVAKKAP